MITRFDGSTWSECLAQALKILAIPSTERDLLSRAYIDIAAEWAASSAYGPTPFPSGVCPDGAPLELSIRIGRQGQTSARFIAQPCDPSGSSEAENAWTAERTIDFVLRWAGPESAAKLQEALSIYPQSIDPSFTGNFRFWLGLASSASGKHISKVYFNPWACQAEYRGALVLHHLLNCAGIPTEGLHRMIPWLEVDCIPHIVGWNIAGDQVASIKLYLQGMFDIHTLEHMKIGSQQPDSNAWAYWAQASAQMRPRGEVHVALVYRPDTAPVTRLNLFCPDWFRSDADVISALQAQFPECSTDVWTGIEQLVQQTQRSGRIINFASVDPEAATVYLRVG